MNLFPNPLVGNSFLKGGVTDKPIAGTALETAYSKPLHQARLKVDNLMQGMPVTLKNEGLAAEGDSTNNGLAGNVLTADKATTSIQGFIVNSPNDVYMDGDDFPKFFKNQIVRVATVGSGATIYLPANANCKNVAIDTPIGWDATNGELATTGNLVNLEGVKIDGQVVRGLVPYFDDATGTAKAKDAFVMKVIL